MDDLFRWTMTYLVNVADRGKVALVEREEADALVARLTDQVLTLGRELVAERERSLQILGVLRNLVDEGPFGDSDHSQWACCGASYMGAGEHAPNCPYQIAVELIAAIGPHVT